MRFLCVLKAEGQELFQRCPFKPNRFAHGLPFNEVFLSEIIAAREAVDIRLIKVRGFANTTEMPIPPQTPYNTLVTKARRM